MGMELLWPSVTAAIRGSVVLGIWGRAEGALHSWDFFCEGRHARDLPTPEIQRYGPLLSWIISRYIFLLPVGGLGSCDIVSPPPSLLSFSITSYSSRCA